MADTTSDLTSVNTNWVAAVDWEYLGLGALLLTPYTSLPFTLALIPGILFVLAPGYFVVASLDPDLRSVNGNLCSLDRLVFSAGAGLFIHVVAVATASVAITGLGVERPMDGPFIFVGPTLATLGAYFAFVRRQGRLLDHVGSEHPVDVSPTGLGVYLSLAALPAMAAAGAHVLNTTGWNGVSVAFFMLAAVMVAVLLRKQDVTDRQYLVASYTLALGLILILSLRTSAVVGSDIHKEVRTVHRVVSQGHWILDSMISYTDTVASINILGPLFIELFDLTPFSVFKISYPLVTAVAPPVSFLLFRRLVSSRYAFASTVLTMYHVTFWAGMNSNNRMGVAMVFMLLFILTVAAGRNRLLQIIFAVGLVASHYTVTLVFLILHVGTVFLTALVRLLTGENAPEVGWWQTGLLATVAFVWYDNIYPGLFVDLLGLGVVEAVATIQRYLPLPQSGRLPGDRGGSSGVAGSTDISVADTVILADLVVEYAIVAIGAAVVTVVLFERRFQLLRQLNDVVGIDRDQTWMRTLQRGGATTSVWILAIVALMLFVVANIASASLAASRVQAQTQFLFSPLFIPGLFAICSLLLGVGTRAAESVGVADPLKRTPLETVVTGVVITLLVTGLLIQTGMVHLAVGTPFNLNVGGPSSSNKFVSKADITSTDWVNSYTGERASIQTDKTGERLFLSTGHARLAEQLLFRVEQPHDRYLILRTHVLEKQGSREGAIIWLLAGENGTQKQWNKVYDAGSAEVYHRPA